MLKESLQAQERRFADRYDDLAADLYHTRAQSAALREQCQQACATAAEIHSAMAELRGKLAIKQGVIQQLLPFYPHPLTPELRWQIEC